MYTHARNMYTYKQSHKHSLPMYGELLKHTSKFHHGLCSVKRPHWINSINLHERFPAHQNHMPCLHLPCIHMIIALGFFMYCLVKKIVTPYRYRWLCTLPAHSNYCIPCICCHPSSDSLQKIITKWCALIST